MISFDIYPGGCRNVLTMSYDDGTVNDRKLVEIFNRYGIKGTFNLNSDRFDKEGFIGFEEAKELYDGHEVAVHTKGHLFLDEITQQNVYDAVFQDRKALEKCTGKIVRGMAYPYGRYNDSVINVVANAGIVYSRTCNSTGQFKKPINFLQWNPTCHHNKVLDYTDMFISSAKSTWCSRMFYVWGHSYEFNNDNNWELIEDFCKRMSELENVWFATNLEIFDYITAQKQLLISADETMICNPTALDVWIIKDGQPLKIPAGKSFLE